MNQRIYICLGRYGDILNILPLLWADAQDGHRSAIMVAKEYANIMDGVSYADCVVFDGNWLELARAHADAVKLSYDVKVCQTGGSAETVKALAYAQIGSDHFVTDAFDKEAWKLAGRLAEWGTLPLVIDQRDPVRGAGWLPKKHRGPSKPIMLVCTSGTSSPFSYTDLLMILLRLQFPQYNIIDISEIKCHRIYDLLGLFEQATVLVTTDSAPLHLARAVMTLPVVALVQDKPRLWYGSAWRPNHIAHIRYSDFAAEAVDMLHAIENIKGLASFMDGFYEKEDQHIIHVWTPADVWSPKDAKEAKTEHEEVSESWEEEYLETSCEWISCRLGIGAFGRDSRLIDAKETKRLPFVRDIVQRARQMANDDDVICLTRANFKFWPGIGKEILAKSPCFAHRSIGGQYHPAVDMFAFSKAWWDSIKKDFPDFVFGHDQNWHRVLWEIMKANGGTEIESNL